MLSRLSPPPSPLQIIKFKKKFFFWGGGVSFHALEALGVLALEAFRVLAPIFLQPNLKNPHPFKSLEDKTL